MAGGVIQIQPSCCPAPVTPTVACEFSCKQVDGSGQAPAQLLATIRGLLDNDCTDCTDFNSTYTVDFLKATSSGGDGSCWWFFAFPSSICGVNQVAVGYVLVELEKESGPADHWFATVYLVSESWDEDTVPPLASEILMLWTGPPTFPIFRIIPWDCLNMGTDAEGLTPSTALWLDAKFPGGGNPATNDCEGVEVGDSTADINNV